MFNQRRYRPLGIADLFDEAFDLYKANFTLFLGAAAVIFVPLHILMIAVVVPMLTHFGSVAQSGGFEYDQFMSLVGRSMTLFAIGLPIYMLFYTVLDGALTDIIGKRYLEHPASIGAAYSRAMHRLWTLLASALVAFLFILFGYILIFPGILFTCRYICLPQVVMLEPKRSVANTLRRAWHLTSNSYGSIASCLFLLWIVQWALSLAVQGFLSMIIGLVPLTSLPFLSVLAAHRDITDQVAEAFSDFIISPFAFTVLSVLYYDLRIRNEGYDMTIMAEHLGYDDAPEGLPSARLSLPQAKRKFWQRPRTPGVPSP